MPRGRAGLVTALVLMAPWGFPVGTFLAGWLYLPPLLLVGGAASLLALKAVDALADERLATLIEKNTMGPYSTAALSYVCARGRRAVQLLALLPVCLFALGMIAILVFGDG